MGCLRLLDYHILGLSWNDYGNRIWKIAAIF